MSFLYSNNSEFVSAKITQKGRNAIARGNFKIEFFQIGDSEFDYNSEFNNLTGFTNHQKVMIPFDKSSGVKYPYKLDDVDDSPTYGEPILNSTVETLRNVMGPAGFVGSYGDFDGVSGTSISGQVSEVTIASLNGTDQITVAGIDFTNTNFILIVLGDISAAGPSDPIFYSNKTSLLYKIVEKTGQLLTLDRLMPDLSALSGNAEVMALEFGTSPIGVISNDCIPAPTDPSGQQDSWMLNVVWTTKPIGDGGATVDEELSGYTSNRYASTKEYFGYTSTGQTFVDLTGGTITNPTSFKNSFDEIVGILPNEQRTIAIIHYSENDKNINDPDMIYKYDDYISYSTDTEDMVAVNGQDELITDTNYFEVFIPFIYYHRTTGTTSGHVFKMDEIDYYMKSTVNQSHSELFRYLIDETGTRVGKVFPHSKLVIIDDQDLVAVLDYRSNRRFTLGAPKVSPIPSNVNSIISGTTSQTFWVTYMFNDTDTQSSLNNFPSNYYIKLEVNNGLDECSYPIPSNVGVEFGGNVFQFMKTTSVDYVNGFLAKKFYVLIQETTDNLDKLPTADQWRKIDFTTQAGGGTYLDPLNITGQTFLINSDDYENADLFDLETYMGSDYLNSSGLTTNPPQFGDDQPFPGSIRLVRATDIEELNFLINLPTGQFETTQNPTYVSGVKYFTEVALLDKNKNPLVMGKLSTPIKRLGTQVVAVKLDF
jgi:hypothetical protein